MMIRLTIMLLLIIGIWVGMILGISFMEAPLKFRAPNMTMQLALGVGKIVFNALNKVEICFSMIVLAALFFMRHHLDAVIIYLLIGIVLIVLLQSLWLLPLLDARAEIVIQGGTPPPSHKHLIYVICELSKVILLIISFIKIYTHD